ncbi:hypothetical protein DIPPA_07102 [Diplonema papillatum]|nr:hypothetical protein DIPPA_07102 [Diplonema papillatum]
MDVDGDPVDEFTEMFGNMMTSGLISAKELVDGGFDEQAKKIMCAGPSLGGSTKRPADPSEKVQASVLKPRKRNASDA